MNKTIRAIFYFYVTIGVAGCFSLVTKEGCESARLFDLGYRAARFGGSSDRFREPISFDRYAKRCAKTGVTLNKAKYREGWTAGLKELCVYKGGYELGLSAYKYYGICPDDKAKDFLKGYVDGQQARSVLTLTQQAQSAILINKKLPDKTVGK